MKKTAGCAFLMLVFLAAGCGSGSLSSLFPKSVSQFKLTTYMEGEEASREITRMHGKKLNLEKGAVALYDGAGDKSSTVWVAELESPEEAEAQERLKLDKLAASPKSPFIGPVITKVEGVTVNRFNGLGQSHFVFRTGDLLWWISTDPQPDEAFVRAFVEAGESF